MSPQTYHWWRRKYGQMDLKDARAEGLVDFAVRTHGRLRQTLVGDLEDFTLGAIQLGRDVLLVVGERGAPHYISSDNGPGPERWLLIEKLPGGETKFSISNLPASTPLKELVALAHQRWKVEQGCQQLKEELGHFEGRSWRGMHHHLALCFMAYDFLTLLRRQRQKNEWPSLPAEGHL